jgi:hypothetical protein
VVSSAGRCVRVGMVSYTIEPSRLEISSFGAAQSMMFQFEVRDLSSLFMMSAHLSCGHVTVGGQPVVV